MGAEGGGVALFPAPLRSPQPPLSLTSSSVPPFHLFSLRAYCPTSVTFYQGLQSLIGLRRASIFSPYQFNLLSICLITFLFLHTLHHISPLVYHNMQYPHIVFSQLMQLTLQLCHNSCIIIHFVYSLEIQDERACIKIS